MKKLLKVLEKGSYLLLFFCSIAAFSQVTIKSQSFEGVASDNLTYTTTSATVTVASGTGVSGSKSLSLRGNNQYATFENINLTGYTNVEVALSFASLGVDNDEDLFIQFSYDNGSTYQSAIKLVDGSSNKTLSYGTSDASANPFVLSVPSGNNNVQFRIYCVGVDGGEFYYIDNITVRGIGHPEINLTANGTNIASGSSTIATAINTDFGSTDINTGTVSKTFTIQNTGTVNLSIWSVYTNSGDFSASASSSTIAPGSSATLTVVFNPTNAGTRNGVISISNSDSDEGTYTFAVSGIGTEQEINLQGGSPLTNIPNGSTLIANSIDTNFGSTPGTKTYTIQNTGTSNLSLWSAWSSLTDYTVTYSPSTIAPGASGTLTVVFSPTAAGTRTATISLSNNDADEGTYSFNVSGTASDREINVRGNGNNIVSGSTAIALTNNTDFGTTDIATGTVTKTFVIENTGGLSLSIWSVYSNSGEFTPTVSASSIAPGGTATLTVVFDPNTLGLRNGIISISNNDANESTYTFAVRGNATDKEINLQGGSPLTDIPSGSTTISNTIGTDFGNSAGVRTYTIQNTGSTALTISSVSSNLTDFTVSVTPSTIAAGSTGTLTVNFNPTTSGTRTATITIANNDADESNYTFRVSGNPADKEINVIGNGTTISSGTTVISTARFTDFGSQDINTGSLTNNFVIQNTGNLNLTISSVTSNNPGDFTVSVASNTIVGGSSTTLSVTFNPSTAGTRDAIITINNNDSNEGTYTFAVRGIGTEQEINVQGGAGPSNITNGSTTISNTLGTNFGSASATRTFVVQNTGTSNLNISSVSSTSTEYAVSISPNVVTPGSTATLTIVFNPTTSGTRTATITISSNDTDESNYTFAVSANVTDKEINVKGNGVSLVNGHTIISTARNTDFGSVQVDGGLATNSFVIENTGGLPLNVTNITCNNTFDYIVNFIPTTIPAGGTMTFTVDFNPITNGVRTGTIYISSNDADESNYRFNISGRGLQDNDGDLVDSSIDIDDDNDGITDIIECGTCLSDPFVNGSFETPVIAASSYAILPTSSVNGWQTSAENFIEIWSSGFNGVPAASGNQFAELNANVPGTLYQTFCLNGAGGTINWSIKHRGRGGVDQAFVKMGSTLANALASIPIVEMVDDNTAWGTYSGIYSIPVGQTQIVITFQAGYTGSGSASVGNFIDDVQIVINQGCIDSDGDGIPDTEDLDSDNDGIPDIEEAGFKQFSNNTATFDKSNPSLWTDANSNGMNDYIASMITAGTYNVPDTDGDGLRNYLDFDSDNDSFFDVNEGGLLNGDGDINDDGKGDGVDTDRDGILDLYDNTTTFGVFAKSYAQDTDGDGIADFLELDANNDGIFDITTSLYDNIDTNNDGKVDGTADVDRDGILDAFDTNPAVKGSPRNLNKKLLLDFDGRNDYAESAPVVGGLANATLMAWIDLRNGYSNEGVVVGQDKFQIKVNSNRKLEAVVNNTSVTSTDALNTAQWYHVAAVMGNGELKLYLNGTMIKTKAVSGGIEADATNFTLGKNPAGTNKFFNGKIDEVRLFNVALTDTQVQRMVYQEIENNGSQVRGTVIPRDIQSLPYTNLIRYYRMDSYKDDIVDDLVTPGLDVVTGMKMYNHKNIYVQQAPMPFVTRTPGSFATAVNDTANDIRGLDLNEYDYAIVRVNHNITEPANVATMGMIVNSGVTVDMNNDNKLENKWYLKLDGKIDLSGKSQLVQTVDSELDVTSTGFIERDQTGQSNKFNYNYWASPVSSINNTTVNHGYTVAGVMKDGTTTTPQNIQWTTGVNSVASSPITLSSYWIFKFQNLTNSYANWTSVGQNGTILAGQGFTLKGSNAATPKQNYTFVGKPNNGTITSTVAANNLNLCGNPYPSAIDADKFIDDNIGSISGTLLFWEHYNTNTSHNTIQYQGGYATYTKVGGTPPVAPAGSCGLGMSNRSAKRFIPVGQGFFVSGNTTGGTITFNNSQRIFVKEDNGQSQYLFRNGGMMAATQTAINAEDTFETEQFTKLRLGYVSANNYHRQLLLGFMNQHATSGLDNGYDAISTETLASDMYFIQGTTKLNIIGDGYFNAGNSYPLGVKNATAGNVKFNLDDKENLAEDQEVYIFDNTTGIYHSIKSQPFEINLPVGTIENRFFLRFSTTGALGTNDNEMQNGISVAHTQTDNTIHIKNELMEATIKSVELYNLLGQKVADWSLENQFETEMHLPVNNVSTGTYIVKIATDKGDISKKILTK